MVRAERHVAVLCEPLNVGLHLVGIAAALDRRVVNDRAEGDARAVVCCAGARGIQASEVRVDLWALSGLDLLFDLGEGQVGALEEVLVDLVLDETVEGVADLFGLRVGHVLGAVDLEALLEILVFKLGADRCWTRGVTVEAPVDGVRAVAAVGVVTVVKFV